MGDEGVINSYDRLFKARRRISISTKDNGMLDGRSTVNLQGRLVATETQVKTIA